MTKAADSDHWLVGPGDAGMRLDKFLAGAGRLGSRGRATWALERGKVLLNEGDASPADAGRRLATGDRIRLWLDRPGSARQRAHPVKAGDSELRIVYEDDGLIVVNKPAGLLTVPLPHKEALSVEDLLLLHLRPRGKRKPLVVHRIDRDTSGLVLFATQPDVQRHLRAQFRRHEPERVYLAFVYGVPNPPAGSWRDHLVWDDRALIQKATHARDPKGRESQSDYRVVETFGTTSLLEVRLVTGKRNQIRLQARLRGHTLIGEQRYTFGPDELRPVEFPRQALHAFQLSVEHPGSGRRLSFEAPLPDDLQGLLRDLRAENGPGSVKLRQPPQKIGFTRGPAGRNHRLTVSKE